MARFQEKGSGRLIHIIEKLRGYQSDEQFLVIVFQDTQERLVLSTDEFNRYFHKNESYLTTTEKLELYQSLFDGRKDVFAKSYITDQGKIQYYPSYHYGWRQLAPEKRSFEPLTEQILKSHLRGETSIGLFPILKNDTCHLLAIDFDKKDWKKAITALWEVANQYDIEMAVEISRSGNGAHAWFFFSEAVSCRQARQFGKNLLSLAMQSSPHLSFDSFDRLFPNQDVLPKGGFGNLIALPLQGEAYQKGHTVFVDKDFIPYSNQWDFLQNIQRITKNQILKLSEMEECQNASEDSLSASLSNVLTIQKETLSPKLAYQLKKMASFVNPEYYMKQAMRQPTYKTPERIYLFQETDSTLELPRGLISLLKEQYLNFHLVEEPIASSNLSVYFCGSLRFEQEAALADIERVDNGVISAGTGFGKTVLASALISQRKVKTIILVHNSQLMEQWLDRLSQFLRFEEDEAIRYTPSGRKKIIGHIGQFSGLKKWRSQLVDIAMIQSLAKLDDLDSVLSDYDMMIVDECHHVTAFMFEQVVSHFAGKFLYGLTATPERKNGHEPILYQRIGPIIHKAESHPHSFQKILDLQFTSFGKLSFEQQKSTDFVSLVDQLSKDRLRNRMIINDVISGYQDGRKILVLTNRVEHLDRLSKLLLDKGIKRVYVISGQSKKKERLKILDIIQSLERDASFVLLSTGKYVGEGFDLPQLDCLILAAPLSWKNNLIQYAGRIHRDDEGKRDVKIIDYVDIHIPYLEKMFQKRQIAYRTMGYELNKKYKQSLYSLQTYKKIIDEDIKNAQSKIFIQTSFVNQSKLGDFFIKTRDCHVELVIPKPKQDFSWLKSYSFPDNVEIRYIESQSLSTVIVIDESTVWFGTIPILAGTIYDENSTLLRLESTQVAQEILGFNSTKNRR